MTIRDPHRPRPRVGRVMGAFLAAVMAVGCGGNGDGDTGPGADGPSSGTEVSETTSGAGSAGFAVTLDELAEASGDAPAATGADLVEAPGPAERRGLPDVGEVAASITAADGTVTGCCLLVAATDQQRRRGLMEVTDLGGYQGMVFVWDHDVDGGFWMRNTPTPLSIAWFDADGAFVSTADMVPCSATADDCPVYPPDGPYRFAVEMFQGDLDALGVGPGSRLALGGECAEATGAG